MRSIVVVGIAWRSIIEYIIMKMTKYEIPDVRRRGGLKRALRHPLPHKHALCGHLYTLQMIRIEIREQIYNLVEPLYTRICFQL